MTEEQREGMNREVKEKIDTAMTDATTSGTMETYAMETDSELLVSEEVKKAEKKYKDRVFRMLFNDKKELLSLYNALNETNYTDPEQIEIVTLENAVYMNMKNDLAFVMMFELNLYEHQSTFSPNMPLRDLFYISKELQGMIETKYLYGTKALQIPTPRFVVLYNGIQEQPEKCVLKLSDLFQQPTDDPELELKVTVLNINPGMNEGLMEKCKTLHEYMLFVERVRTYAKKMPLQEAVVRAVDECIREGILADFLHKNRNEAIEMCIFEYDEEEVMEVIREEQYQRGKEIGYEEGEKTGYEKGEERLSQLGKLLMKDNRMGDFTRAIEDKDYRTQLYREYGL